MRAAVWRGPGPAWHGFAANWRGLAASLMLMLSAALAAGQAGVLIPSDGQAPDSSVLSLDDMLVRVRIDNGDAHVSITQIFSSHSDKIQEGNYTFALPEGATVSDFAVWDGPVRIPAVILERRRAQEVYEQTRLQAIDPGLLAMGERDAARVRQSALFTARIVPIAPWGTKRLELEYHQRIATTDLRQQFTLPLKPAEGAGQTAGHFRLVFELQSENGVEGFHVVSDRMPLAAPHDDGHLVSGAFEASAFPFTGDFQAEWSLNASGAGRLGVLVHRDPVAPLPDAGTVVGSKAPPPPAPEPGFFEAQLLVAPAAAPVAAVDGGRTRSVIVLLDTSLSMQWSKLERSFAALEGVLRSLRPTDRFNVLLFNQEVKPCRPEPVAASPQEIDAALACVRASRLRGGTDLGKALAAGLGESTAAGGELVLLTDGNSDRGLTVRPGSIAAAYAAAWRKAAHPPRTEIFAVGDDADTTLLRQLAHNDGLLEHVLTTEPYELKLHSFLSRIAGTAVSGLNLVASPPSAVSLVYPLNDSVYPGSVAEWVGQYRPGAAPVTLTANGMGSGRSLNASASTPLPERELAHPQLPRLWAQARVEALLEEIDHDGETAAAIDEIIRLSRRYKFVTPYTSFLAVPRSLLRPRVIRPGDPVLRVRTDPAIASVIAVFPFGLTKPLRHLTDEDRPAHGDPDDANELWETRFLAPPEMHDGTYNVRLILRDTHGNVYREGKTFVISSTPPTVRIALPRTRLHRGERVALAVRASGSTRTLTARLEGAAPVALHWDPQLLRSTGVLEVPAGLPVGRYRLTVTAEDVAHNLGTQEVTVDVVP